MQSPLSTALARDRIDETTKDQAERLERPSRGKVSREDWRGQRRPEEVPPEAAPLQGPIHWRGVNANPSTRPPGPVEILHYEATAAGRTWPLPRRRVTRASARDDDGAAVAVLVIKGVNKAVSPAPAYEGFLFGDKAVGRRYAPRTTSPWAPPRSLQHRLAVLRGRWLSGVTGRLCDHGPSPWTTQLRCTPLHRFVAMREPFHWVARRDEARGAYIRRGSTSVARDPAIDRPIGYKHHSLA